MALLDINNVAIRGLSCCVPANIYENVEYPIGIKSINKLISTIGIERKRTADVDTCSSDLCLRASEKLLNELHWGKNEIDCLIFVSQTPDYRIPPTSCLLQFKLGLSRECFTLDISLGCSGWIYGLSVISSLISSGNGKIRKALLLAGDTPSKFVSYKNNSAWPLFGDAGSATALEFEKDAEGMKFHLATDGSGANSIIIRDGGFRNYISATSYDINDCDEEDHHNGRHLSLDGIEVFSFGIDKGPESVNNLIEKFSLSKDDIDYFIFHQANRFLNENIRRKLKLPTEKVPYSLKNFGNTSCASIPITMVTELQENLMNKCLKHVACGFGSGLSWGSVYFSTDHIIVPELIEYE